MEKRRVVVWRWEDADSQRVFAEWVGFSPAAVSAREVDEIEALLDLSPPAEVLD